MAKLYCHSYFLPFAVQELFHAVLCGNAKPTDILKQIWKLGFPQNSLRSSFSPDSWNSKLSSHSHVLRTNSNLSFSDVRNCCFLSILDVGEFGFWYNTNQVSGGRNSPYSQKVLIAAHTLWAIFAFPTYILPARLNISAPIFGLFFLSLGMESFVTKSCTTIRFCC